MYNQVLDKLNHDDKNRNVKEILIKLVKFHVEIKE